MVRPMVPMRSLTVPKAVAARPRPMADMTIPSESVLDMVRQTEKARSAQRLSSFVAGLNLLKRQLDPALEVLQVQR
jgi:hypothetical protein